MMNYDDHFTRDFEENFQKRLKIARNFMKKDMQKLQEYLDLVCEFVDNFDNNRDNSLEDIELYRKLSIDLPIYIQKMNDMRLILDENIYRQSRVQYEHIKKLAKEGNKEAEKIYLELKSDFEKFDVN